MCDCRYGLADGVFSNDVDRAKRVAHQLRAGILCAPDTVPSSRACDFVRSPNDTTVLECSQTSTSA